MARRDGIDQPTGPIPTVASGHVRALILVMYTAFTAAGVASFLFPSRAVTERIDPSFAYVWAGFFLIGGLLCLAGHLSGSWWGEVVGLPLIASSSLLYGCVVALQYGPRRDGAFIFVGVLLIAQGLSIVDRWVAKWRLLRVAQRISREAPD